MNYIETRILEYLPLEPIELAFKYIFENHIPLSEIDSETNEIRKWFPEHGKSPFYSDYRDFCSILRSMPENEPLADKHFFSPGQAISITRHPRYMPRILHNHQGFFEIQCLLHGKLYQSIQNIPVTLLPGDLCFIAPNAMHAPHVTDDDTIMINILVRTDTLRTVFSNALADEDVISEFIMRILYGKTYQPLLICHTHLDPLSFGLVLDMIKASEIESSYTDNICSTMLQLLFLCLLKDHKNDFVVGTTLHKNDENILNIVRYIKKHSRTITLPTLAQHFNYTESHLSFLIKKFYGYSFQEMLANLRLEDAASLLVSSALSVSDIVATVGYTDNSYFFRIFKRKFGMTPSQYRKAKGLK